MAAKKEAPPARPLCSTCAEELRSCGFRVTFGKNAQLYVDKCSVCGHRLPVHSGQVEGRGRKRKRK